MMMRVSSDKYELKKTQTQADTNMGWNNGVVDCRNIMKERINQSISEESIKTIEKNCWFTNKQKKTWDGQSSVNDDKRQIFIFFNFSLSLSLSKNIHQYTDKISLSSISVIAQVSWICVSVCVCVSSGVWNPKLTQGKNDHHHSFIHGWFLNEKKLKLKLLLHHCYIIKMIKQKREKLFSG